MNRREERRRAAVADCCRWRWWQLEEEREAARRWWIRASSIIPFCVECSSGILNPPWIDQNLVGYYRHSPVTVHHRQFIYI